MAAKAVEMELTWEGVAENEIGVDAATGKTIVRVNPQFYRPAEVDVLIGDPTKAASQLSWNAKVSLESLCRMMVEKDVDRNERGVVW